MTNFSRSRVIEINDIEALDGYRLVWQSLLGETRGASFFQTLDWLQCYWRHYGKDQRLRVMLVSDGQKPIGIVPLTVIREKTGVGWMRVLTYPLHGWGWFYGPIGPQPTATLTTAMKHIAQTSRDWDMCDLRWIDNDRLDHGRTHSALETAGMLATKRVWQPTAVVDLESGWDAYFAGMSSKQRNNLRRCEKRVAELGDVELIRHRPLGSAQGDDDPRWDIYDDCLEVARRSWQADATDGTTISHASDREFFRETYALAVKNGMADLNLLRVGGRPIAFSYNYHHDGYVMGIRLGYDANLTREGAGHVMHHRMLRDSFERGDRVFDLGVGSLDVKKIWQTGLVNSYSYTHYSLSSPRSQILRLKHWLDKRKVAAKSNAGQLAS